MQAAGTVLLVEDDENDAYFFKRAVQKNNLPLHVHVAQNGQEAMNYMKGEGPFANREEFPLPNFIITDNRMPMMSGWEFLIWLKQNPQLRVTPTIVLGGSASPDDIKNAYETLGVNSYVLKPSNAEALEQIVKTIFQYWAICAIPSSM